MASTRRTNAALAVKQVDTITVALTWAAADTATITIGVRAITITVGATVTTASIATAIKEAINGDTQTTDATFSDTGNNIPEFTEVVATVSSSVVTVTAVTAGKPFTMTATETTAGNGTATRAAVTAAAGPNYWTGANNWSNGVPANGDTVYFDNSDISILYDLDQSAVTVAAMYVALSYTGFIGLPEINQDGAAYREYRDQYLKIGATILQVGSGPGLGSGRIKIDNSSIQTALTVIATGTSADTLPAMIWKGTHASNALVQRGGDLGSALFGAEVATLATITAEGGSLRLGTGVTLSGALVNSGGAWQVNSLIDGSLTMNAGSAVIDGTGNVDQLTVNNGTVIYNTNGTLGGNTVLAGSSLLDFGQDTRTVSITNVVNIYGNGAFINDPLKRTGSVSINFNKGASSTQAVLGTDMSLVRGALI